MELLNDYDLTIEYHPGKTNVVVNTLSRKTITITYWNPKQMMHDVENLGKEGELCFMGRLYVLNGDDIRKEIIWETHQGPFSLYPRSLKMYPDLRTLF
ncbi:DNA/RNA polymerases superfamily protein [Gossypium australe]|uniref:DNA/RNA polymerases superfamily protein n=1 Tax=Gossypium australe TaxID=47621 RepID=A0A5B6VW21_9ROSI|nr:DNA/RNA polymerases superfamily protein [Gossypium australe]